MRAVTNEIGSHADASAPVEAIRPPRLNFARICLYCDGRDCQSPKCIASYARSRWVVCPDCDGLCWSPTYEPCGCMFGVIEAAPAPPAITRELAAV